MNVLNALRQVVGTMFDKTMLATVALGALIYCIGVLALEPEFRKEVWQKLRRIIFKKQ